MKYISDCIYDFIKVDDVAKSIIDTPEYQRLRNIKQLGVVHYIYPSTTHTRFEHSLGVYHLAGELMKHLKESQPELKITDKMILMVKIAGLVHDIGHVFLSHIFDYRIMPKLKISHKEHEERGIELFEYICKKYKVSLSDDEIKCINSMIMGQKYKDYPDFMFEIVANKENSLDVDKMDYLMRDCYYVNLSCGFNYRYLFNMTKVIDNHICYHKKVAYNIYQLFNLRYTMHKKVYQHWTTIKIEHMVSDVILKSNHILKLENYFNKQFGWTKLTDMIFFIIDTHPDLEEARQLMERVYNRNFYKKIEVDDGSDNIITNKRHLGYTNQKENPINYIRFFDNDEKNKYYYLKKEEISRVLPNEFYEEDIQFLKRN